MAAKQKNNKPTESSLVDLAATLGIPSEVAEEAIDIALKTGDPEQYIRNFAAQSETMAAAEGAELPGVQPTAEPVPDIRNVDLSASIAEIPMATHVSTAHGPRVIDDVWPPRIGHVGFNFERGERHMQDALTRLFHGLQGSNARLRGRCPDEPSRPITNQAGAIKWLLEQLSL
jgi:hypothetical protein